MSTGPVRADPLAQRRERTRAPDARKRAFVAYGAVAGAIAAAMLAHLKVLPSLGIVAPLLPFIPAVLLGAWLGGLGPGLAATLLGAAAGGFVLLAPEFTIDAIARHEWLRLFLFVVSGAVISVVIEQMHRARRRAERLAAEHRDAVVASRVSAERLAVILHHVPVGIGLLDRTGRFILSNPVLDRLPLKGIPSADSTEAARWKVVDAAGDALARDMWPGARALRGEVVSPGLECEYTSGSGERKWYSISAAPIRNDGGTVENAVIVVQDIDRLKRASEALEEADRRKDEFLATLAHELRNPLAPIWNAVEILGRHDADPERRDEARRVIDRQVRHMVRLVDDLMDVSRITRDKLELRRESIELGALVEHAVQTVRPRADQAGVRIRMTMSSAPLTVLADPVRLTQVLTNVLNNAIKYSYADGTVSLVVESRTGNAVVTVQDEGIGFDALDADRLFEMFSQSSPAIDHSQSGLGIGLWLSRRLMEMHGGFIDAESAGRRQGSRFTLTLPLHERTAAGGSPAPRGDVPVQHFRVLVVDDNVDNAATLAELMASGGNEVAVAHDGEAALSAVREFNPDVVLLDIGLPKLDGYEVCRRVRAERGGERLAILAMTGWGQAEDRRKSAAVGFDAHLVKPIDFQRLNEAVALASSQRGVRPAASRI